MQHFVRSLCEIGGNCFGPWYLFWENQDMKQTLMMTHNDQNKDVAKLLLNVINNSYFWHFCMHFKCTFYFSIKILLNIFIIHFEYSSLFEYFDQSKHTFTARFDKRASTQWGCACPSLHGKGKIGLRQNMVSHMRSPCALIMTCNIMCVGNWG